MFYSDDKKQFTVLNRRSFVLYILKLSLFKLMTSLIIDGIDLG